MTSPHHHALASSEERLCLVQWGGGGGGGGGCALHHDIQNSMEAILSCHPARSTEWLGWMAISCELWHIHSLIFIASTFSRWAQLDHSVLPSIQYHLVNCMTSWNQLGFRRKFCLYQTPKFRLLHKVIISQLHTNTAIIIVWTCSPWYGKPWTGREKEACRKSTKNHRNVHQSVHLLQRKKLYHSLLFSSHIFDGTNTVPISLPILQLSYWADVRSGWCSITTPWCVSWTETLEKISGGSLIHCLYKQLKQCEQ